MPLPDKIILSIICLSGSIISVYVAFKSGSIEKKSGTRHGMSFWGYFVAFSALLIETWVHY